MFLQMSPAAMFNQARNLFLSEEFYPAMELIRNSFSEEDLSDETILDFLKGKIGFNAEGEQVVFDEEYKDEEYSSEIEDVLSSYDNIFKNKDDLFELKEKIEFNLCSFAETNDFFTYLKDNKNTFILTKDFKYEKELSMYDIDSLELNDAIYYNENGVFLFKSYKKANIKEITIVKSDINDVINIFEERGF